MDVRQNPDLDEFMRITEDTAPRRRKIPRRKSQVLKRDAARRYAFRVLNVLSGLDLSSRKKVLAAAVRLNEA